MESNDPNAVIPTMGLFQCIERTIFPVLLDLASYAYLDGQRKFPVEESDVVSCQ